MADARLAKVQESLLALEQSRDLASAKKVVRDVSALLVPSLSEDTGSLFRLFNDQDGKLKANAGWFFSDSTITDKLATYTLDTPAESNLDIKVFGVKKAKKGTISWAVGLTPNFEDEPFNGKFNVGIDFIIPESLDRVILALSKNYVIRTLELKGQLTATFQEILNSWMSVTDLSRKVEFHEILWNSLDLSPINKKFYEGISQRFISLRQHIETSGALDNAHAAQFVNRLIGRVIFVWFLDKKALIEPSLKYFESEAYSDDTDYYREKLEPLFFEVLNTPVDERTFADKVTPYLNGGLFESKPGDLYKDKSLTFPKNYFDEFLRFLRSYNFTTDESTTDFQQVAIDPEMLGRIFENLLAEVSDDTGEQARKARGAFYTPREIVDQMCREALKTVLRDGHTDDPVFEQRLTQLVDGKDRDFLDQDHNWRRDFKPYKTRILETLEGLRILDPACGSGAFPIGMLQLLLKVYIRLDSKYDTYKTKLFVLERNIFGADIEPMAVEISRLRAWLSLVVGQLEDVKRVQPLPNLDFKFVCANTLVPLLEGTELILFEDTTIQEKLQVLREGYFASNSHQQKMKMKRKYSELVTESEDLFGDSDRTTQLKSFRPFDADNSASFFDPREMFGVEDFHIVIGNPPYVDSEFMTKHSKELRNYLKKQYRTTEGNWDLFVPFIERGIGLARNKGVVSYIVKNSLLGSKYAESIRKLMSEYQLEEILDFGQVRVFESASVATCVFRLKKDACEGESVFSLMKNTEQPSFVNRIRSADLAQKSNWIPLVLDSKSRTVLSLVEKLGNLSDLGFTSSAASTVSEAYEIAKFVHNDPNPTATKLKLINTGTIDPYKSLWGSRITKYLGLELMHPVISKLDLESVSSKRATQSSRPKLIAIGMGNVEVFMDLEGTYCAGKTTSILFAPEGKESLLLPFALALLNSRVGRFWFKSNFLAGGMSGLSPENLLTLPVPSTDGTKFERICNLAIQNQSDPTRPHSAEIQNLVEEAYGIDEETRMFLEFEV
jgi:type I restriction-modification system DNA methylase subunit